MQRQIWFCTALVGLILSGPQQEPTDPYSLNPVRSFLNLRASGPHTSWNGHFGPAFAEMGDGASIATLKILDEEDLKEPKYVNAYLYMVENAFSVDYLISLDVNKEPKATIFLLDYLQEKVSNTDLHKKLQDMKVYVKTQMADAIPASSFAGGAVPNGSQQESTDPYSLHSVRSALQIAELGGEISFVSKKIVRLGDGTSIAILKILSKEELANPKKIEACLTAVRMAFAAPDFILLEVNKDPKVTIFLLDYLQEKTQDAELQKKIRDTKTYVKNQTTEAVPAKK